MGRKKAAILLTAVMAALVTSASIAWACTPSMTGTIWLCEAPTFCSYPGQSAFTQGAAVWSFARDVREASPFRIMAGRAGGGKSAELNCHSEGSTHNFVMGSAVSDLGAPGATDDGGWNNVPVELPPLVGSYDLCAETVSDTSTIPAHNSFSVVSII